jgi:hypothetical protein
LQRLISLYLFLPFFLLACLSRPSILPLCIIVSLYIYDPHALRIPFFLCLYSMYKPDHDSGMTMFFSQITDHNLLRSEWWNIFQWRELVEWKAQSWVAFHQSSWCSSSWQGNLSLQAYVPCSTQLLNLIAFHANVFATHSIVRLHHWCENNNLH